MHCSHYPVSIVHGHSQQCISQIVRCTPAAGLTESCCLGADAHSFDYMLVHSNEAKVFDPDGNYVRRWLPVLGRMPAKWIHRCARAVTSPLSSWSALRGKQQCGTLHFQIWASDLSMPACMLQALGGPRAHAGRCGHGAGSELPTACHLH